VVGCRAGENRDTVRPRPAGDGQFRLAEALGVQSVTGTPETLAAAARAASPAVRAGEVHFALIPVMGAEALVCYRLDDGEAARRHRSRAGSLCSADVLELLLGLPIGMPVPVTSLTRRETAALKLAPPGAVSVRDGEVARHAVAPVKVELAVVTGSSWRHGLEKAGRFAPFCARAVALHRHPRDLAEVELQAGFYGVGVIVVDDQSTEVLVPPAPFRRCRWTAAGWRFLEEVYRAVG
jgi:hypothetical protein